VLRVSGTLFAARFKKHSRREGAGEGAEFWPFRLQHHLHDFIVGIALRSEIEVYTSSVIRELA
jgi:hypothetical protein